MTAERPTAAPDPLREALDRANLRELADEAIEGGYRTVQVAPDLLLRLLAAATAPTPVASADAAWVPLRECRICGDYTAQGVEVHDSCLAAIRGTEAALDVALADDGWLALVALAVVAEERHGGDPKAILRKALRARLAAAETETEP